MFDITEFGPNKWTTTPDGGGEGSWWAKAGNAQSEARTPVDNNFNFKHFLHEGDRSRLR